VHIRAGLHTGECETIGNDDIGGMSVHIAARVSAAAGRDEVLVSSTVKDLVVGSGLRFVDRGIHRFKGVPGEWRLHAAVTGGDGGDLETPSQDLSLPDHPPLWQRSVAHSVVTSRAWQSVWSRFRALGDAPDSRTLGNRIGERVRCLSHRPARADRPCVLG
jgi:hypothetical protein